MTTPPTRITRIRRLLSAFIIGWCVLWTMIIGIAFLVKFIDFASCTGRDCAFDVDAVLSLGDFSTLSLSFVVFIGFSVIWFMLRSVERGE